MNTDASPQSAFEAQRTYMLHYGLGTGIYRHLGAFYYTELSQPEDPAAPICVGPGSAIDTVLPVSLELEHDAASLTVFDVLRP